MRLLLISDTHGDLGLVNRQAHDAAADAVVHAGDFGFYDHESAGRLSIREITLQILHSGLPKETIDAARKMTPEELVHLAREKLSMSDLPDYLEGRARFDVPVYAVWGNHEDKTVVEALRDGRYRVPNLFLLDERQCFRLGAFRIFGLGGNLLPGPKLFQAPLAGGGGKIWTTLQQMGQLFEMASRDVVPGEIRVLVTHVSPGKEPLVVRLAAHLRADFLVSGHMGSPYCAVWNAFAIREAVDAESWLESARPAVEKAWEEARNGVRDSETRRLLELGMRVVTTLPLERVRRSRGAMEPAWYRDCFCINLPDAPEGHAVLVESDGRVALETHSKGRSLGGM